MASVLKAYLGLLKVRPGTFEAVGNKQLVSEASRPT